MSELASESPPRTREGASGDSADDQRLGPRPLVRPAVDAAHQTAFGRPSGVDGAFAPRGESVNGLVRVAPPQEALIVAFGRPTDSQDVLQRPPGYRADGTPQDEPPLWPGNDADSWRDPGAHAVIGPPAVDAEPEETQRPAGDRPLSMAELLFGRRVKITALVSLALVAVLLGATGGLVGWLIGRSGNTLTDPEVTLAQVVPGKERPAGSVADIAQRVAPAVVSLEVRTGDSGSVGSGVVIDKAGYVLTNNHVISMAATDPKATLTAIFTDGTRTKAAIVGRDPRTDLAVVKVAVENPTVIALGKSTELAVGDTVIAIGSPLGLASTVTEGIVSALHRPLSVPGENGDPDSIYDAVQTDAAINHGNSGGPLVDSSGALVGINSVIRASGEGGGSIGLGFAIPVDHAIRVAQTLIRDGQIKHSSLGADVKSVSATSAEGAKIANVHEGKAAARAGLAEGDVVIRVGDRRISSAPELNVVIIERNIGDTVQLVVVREGRELTIPVTLDSD